MNRTVSLGALATFCLVPNAFAGGLRGEQQLDLSISAAGARASTDTDIASSGYRVFAAWTEAAVAPATTNEIYYRRSDDGGRTWSSVVALSATASIDDANPSVSADGDLVAIVWLHGLATGTQDVQGVVSTDGGVTFGSVLDLSGPLKNDAGDADSLRVKVLGTRIYAYFEDDVSAPGGNEDVYVAASTNSGATFASPVRVNHTAAGAADCDDPELETTGASVYVTWIDKRTGNDRVYFNRSTNSGVTWQATDLRLDRGGALADAGNPSLSVDASNLHIVWVDDRNNLAVADQVFYVRSTDSGATFSLDKKIGSASNAVDADAPRITVEGSSVYVAWPDARNGLDDLFLAVSSDGGANFAAEVAVDPDGGTVADTSPHLKVSQGCVYLLYKEATYSALLDQVWVSWSPSGGAAGTFRRLRMSSGVPSANDADDFQFTVTDFRDLVAIWTDDRAGGLNNDVWVNGQRFPNLDVIPNGKKISFQLTDSAAADEGLFFVTAFSLSGTDLLELDNGINVCLTYDSFTQIMLDPNILPLVSGTVTGGQATTASFRLKPSGWAVGLVLDLSGVDPVVLAATDPIEFN